MDPLQKLKQTFRSIDTQLKTLHGQAGEAEQRLAALEQQIVEAVSQKENAQRDLATLQGRVAELEQKLQEHQLLQWHMQYFYDQQWALTENARIEALCPGNHVRLLELKDKYKGKRCFIIGNGPSLRAEDLDRLKGEYTFACNRIDLIFDKTDWRPTFYCISDPGLFDMSNKQYADFKQLQCLFASDSLYESCSDAQNRVYYTINRLYRKIPEFNENASQFIYEGGTVTYIEIQLAAYMGFSEIYLLGVDNTYNTKKLEDGRVVFDWKGSHFTENYVDDAVGESTNSWVDLSDRKKCGLYDLNDTYAAARWHADRLGIKIINATRGGALEAFERMDFDAVMEGKKGKDRE